MKSTQDSSNGTLLTASNFSEMVLSLHPAVAVFDCDGTLWRDDAGYEFMVWSIAQGLVSRDASDWIDSRYQLYRAGQVSEIGMCGEMVQIYDRLRETELRAAAATFFRTRIEAGIFPEMKALVAALRDSGADLWAVSSTNNWVIEEGLRAFGFPPHRVLAARVEVVNGTITSKLIEVPSDEGKAIALKRAGVPAPDMVFGNSIHDAAMLEIARHPFAVNPSAELQAIASTKGWPVFHPKQPV